MIKTNSKFMRATVLSICLLSLTSCSNMDENQQRMVSGGAIGVAAGALTTVVTGGCIACGMAIGGAVGGVGGYVIGKIDDNTRSSPSSASAAPSAGYANNSVPQGYPAGGYSQ